VERLRRAAALLRGDDTRGLAEWHREALAHRRRLLEAELVGGPLCQLRVSVENRPGTVAEIALALGRAGVNIEDMALYPAADMRTGAVSLWVAGAEEAERAAQIVRDLGYTVSMVGGSE
jgi:prephenate dehydrogenase